MTRTTVGAATAGDPYFPASGNGGYRVNHYDLAIRYDPRSRLMRGSARLAVTTTTALTGLSLDIHRMKVSLATIDGIPVKHRQHRGKLHLSVPHVLSAGRIDLRIDYAGFPRPVRTVWGDIGWDWYPDGMIIAAQPVGAPSWFPCNDHPSNKSSYQISVTVPKRYNVVATGVPCGSELRNGQITRHFDHPAPVPTYLPTVLVGDFVVSETMEDGLLFRNASPPAQQERAEGAFAQQPAMMRLFRGLFGPYPFDVYGSAVVPVDLDEPVETQTLSLFGVNHLVDLRKCEALVAHELAHHWFGNCVTLDTWRSIWLHEGFARYAEWLWAESSEGIDLDRSARKCRMELAGRKEDMVLADPGARRVFDRRVYDRGALTVHALRHAVGDQDFFGILRAWISDHRYGNASTETFTAFVKQYVGRDLSKFFDAWLYKPALPVIGRTL